MQHSAAPFTVVKQKLIIYICGASQTPSLQVCVLLCVCVYYNVNLGMQRAPFHQNCKVNHL